jgi:hypothetical protein
MAVLVVVQSSIYLAALSVFPNVCEVRYVKSSLTGNAAAVNASFGRFRVPGLRFCNSDLR